MMASPYMFFQLLILVVLLLVLLSFNLHTVSQHANSGGARGHSDEGAEFPDGGAETPRAAAAPPSGVWGGN